jgi:uncharacterized repeat protein (TIGR01451 family)
MDKKLSHVPLLILFVVFSVIISAISTQEVLGSSQESGPGINVSSGDESDNIQPLQSLVSVDIITPDSPDSYPLHPGFPINLARWIEKAPVTIADINGDGSNEMLLPTYNEGTPYPGKIYAWDKNGALLPGFPISTDGHLRGRLALGDLNGDGKLEIAGEVKPFDVDIGAKVYIWKSDGTIFPGWPQETACYQANQYCGVQSIVISDIDGDSDLEVIAGTDNRNLNYNPSLYIPNLYVWHSNGQPAAGNWPAEDPRNCAIIGALAVGDLDGNGSVDIVTGRDYFRLFAYNYQGNELPGWSHYIYWPYDSGNLDNDKISFGRSAITLADLNQDGILEYIVDGLRSYSGTETFYNDDLLVYGPDGQRWQGWDLPATGHGLLGGYSYRMLQAPAIGDMNNDGFPDIIVTQQDGWVRAYTAQKQLLWEFNYAQGQIVYATEAVIGDVNGDGWNEVLFGTFDIDFNSPGPFGVWILDHNGVPLAGANPLVVNDDLGISGAPTLADLDGDGNIEIAAATWRGKIYIWDAPGRALPARMPWPMARHDLQRTGLYINRIPNYSKSTKIASDYTPKLGESVSFIVTLIQSGTPLNETIKLTSTLPADLAYIPGSLTASSGTVNDSQAPTLTWSGSMNEISKVVLSYSTRVNRQTGIITDAAVIDAGTAGNFVLSTTLIVSGKQLFLPVLTR